MMKFATLIFSVLSVPAFAAFTCVEATNANYIMGSQGSRYYISDIQECKKAVDKAVNGFTCVSSARGIYLLAQGGEALYVGNMEKCLESAQSAKN